MTAAFRQRFGAELPGRFGDVVGELQVVNEPFAAQLVAQAVEQHPGGLLGPEHDAFVIDQGDAVAVAVEGDAQVGPLAVYLLAQLGQLVRLRAVGRPAAELGVDRIVDRGKQTLGEDGVQVAPGLFRPATVHRIEHHVPLGGQ